MSEILLDPLDPGFDYDTDVTIFPDGSYLFSWRQVALSWPGERILTLQKYNEYGIRVGEQIEIPQDTRGGVVASSSGGFAVYYTEDWRASQHIIAIYDSESNLVSETSLNFEAVKISDMIELENGDFLISVLSPISSNPDGLYTQRIDSQGNLIGSLEIVSDGHISTEGDLVALSGGGYAIAWTERNTDETYTAFVQIYDETGATTGAPTVVAADSTGLQRYVEDVEVLENGNIAVSYISYGLNTTLAVQVLDGNGQVLGDSTIVSETSREMQKDVGGGEIAALEGGGFVVLLTGRQLLGSDDPDQDGFGTYVAIYDEIGQSTGDLILVNTNTTGDQGRFVSGYGIEGTPDGGFVVVYSDNAGLPQTTAVIAARFDADGNPLDFVPDPSMIAEATSSHHFSTTLIGTPHSSENGIKERGGFYLGDGVVLTDSRFLDGYDPADIFVQVGATIPGAEQDATTAAGVTSLTSDTGDASEIAVLETGATGAGQTGMVIYANPNDVEGDFVVTGYDRADDAETAHEYDITISQGSYQEVTLKNRTDVNSVLLSDGLPDGVRGGWQGSGVYQELDANGDGTSEFYYVGALVGPYQAGTDQAFAIDPISDSYRSLAASLEDDHSADDFARNALIADSTPTAGYVTMTGTFFHEDLFGGDNQDEFYGMGGDDGLYGGIANDRLFGGDGNDFLVGGAGNDNQTGGAGADTFHFNAGDGRDRIMDFEDETDLISIDAGVTFSDLTITSRGPSSVVDYGSGMITLNGVSASELTEEDFIFA